LNETDNDIKTKSLGMIGLERTILKTGPKEWAGLKEGDIVSIVDYQAAFEPIGQKPKEGEIVKLKVKRNKEFIALDVVVKYGLKEKKNVLRAIEK
jgi:hypothetical protein